MNQRRKRAKNQMRSSIKNQLSKTSKKRSGTERDRNQNNDFPVVGIGASAGGLEAFKALLKNLPEDTGMAFLLVQHLDPTHPTSLPKLLGATTGMPVVEAVDKMAVKPNCIYVIPTNAGMTMKNHSIRITMRSPTELHLPIDALFNSLAQHKKTNAIGVVLSGTGSDGTLGVRTIKSEGGITFAQDRTTAKYAGMPQSAEESGSVDFVLSPDQIATELTRLGQHQNRLQPPRMKVLTGKSDQFIQEIQKILHESTSVDFMNYKPGTIERRIQKRLLVNRIDTLQAYIQLLRQNRKEIESLYHEIFIHVTSFFRDSKKYEALKSKIFPRLLQKTPADQMLRIWVAGCSSGEEVYSLAMTLLEFLRARRIRRDFRIFATDISESEIQRARSGVFPFAIKKDVSAERLKTFFTKRKHDYQIIKTIRENCIFAKHDLIREPPFSQMDLISCCNVLIYLAETAQKRILANFHYSLKSSGILLLGKSESTNSLPSLYEPLDKTNKIYSKRMVPSVHAPFSAPPQQETRWRIHQEPKPAPAVDWEKEADRFVLKKYRHSGFLIDGDMQILAFRGMVTPFLEPSRGAASLQLPKMVRKDLRVEMRMLHQRVKKKMAPVRKERISFQMDDGMSRMINIEEVPIHDSSSNQTVFLILLEDAGREETVPLPFKTKKTVQRKIQRWWICNDSMRK